MLNGVAGGAARYRLQPEVEILSPVTGDKADELAAACPGLFSVQGSGAARTAVAGDARAHELLLEKVLTRVAHTLLLRLLVCTCWGELVFGHALLWRALCSAPPPG